MDAILKVFKKHWWLLLSLILAVFLVIYRFDQGSIQQDNYIAYAVGFPSSLGYHAFYFPGFPLAIRMFMFIFQSPYVAGYFIALASFSGLYILLYKLTGSKLSILALIFPPILFNLATIIGTDMPFIFIIVSALYLIKKKSLPFAFFVIGISIWFRLAGVAVIFGVFIYYLTNKRLREFFAYLPYFFVPIIGLMIYDFFLFGPGGVFFQVVKYQRLTASRTNIVLVQLALDVVRAFRWQWYRILISGVFYIIFYGYVLVYSLKKKSLESWVILGLFIFTLSLGPVPFLENLGRYLAPVVPIFWLIYYKQIKSSWLFYLLLPLSLAVVLI